MKALITGRAGFIGSHLSQLLLDEGDEVFALDDLSTGSLANVAHLVDSPGHHLIVDSILHPAIVNELVNKTDVVYHLAAAVGVKMIVEQPVRTLHVNLRGTETVLDACCKFDKPVLVASTYGDHRSAVPLSESSRRMYGATTQKRWAYADSKAMDEFLALAYHEEFGLETVIVRLFNTVGPRQTGTYGMVTPRFVERALAGTEIEIYGDGNQTRCFCHVEDTIRVLRDLMVDTDRTAGEIFNVGARNQISILALAELVKEKIGSDSPIVHVPFEQVYGSGIEDMLHRVPDTAKVRSTIGWAPTRDLDRCTPRGFALGAADGRGEPGPGAQMAGIGEAADLADLGDDQHRGVAADAADLCQDLDAVVGLGALLDLRGRLGDFAVEVVDQREQAVEASSWRFA